MFLTIINFNFFKITYFLKKYTIFFYNIYDIKLFYNIYNNIFTFFKNFFLKIPKKFKLLKHINYIKYSNFFISILFKKGKFNKILINYKIIFFYLYKYLFLTITNYFILQDRNIINFFINQLFIIYKPIFFFNFVKKKTKKKKIIF